MESWKRVASRCAAIKRGVAEFTKKCRKQSLARIVHGWSLFTQTAANSKKRKAVVRVRQRWSVLQKFIHLWKQKYNSAVSMRQEGTVAETHCETLRKRKAMRGWVLFVNRRYERMEYYGRFLKQHFKGVMTKMLRGWRGIKLRREMLADLRRVVAGNRRSHAKRVHLAIWKRGYQNSLTSHGQKMRGLKLSLLHILQRNVNSRRRKRELSTIAAQMHISNMKRAALRKLRDVARVRISRREKTASLIKREQMHTKSAVMAALRRYSHVRARLCSKEMQFTAARSARLCHMILTSLHAHAKSRMHVGAVAEHFRDKRRERIWMAFRSGAKRDANIRRTGVQVTLRQYGRLVGRIWTAWQAAIRKRESEMYDAGVKHALRIRDKAIKKWLLQAHRQRELRTRMEEYRTMRGQRVLHVLMQGWADYTQCPEVARQKKAIYFYLEHLYRKYLCRLQTYARHRHFDHSLEEYYRLRTKKGAFGGWRAVAKRDGEAREFRKNALGSLARRLLFELFFHSEQSRQHKQILQRASEHLAHSLQARSLSAWKQHLADARQRAVVVSAFISEKQVDRIDRVFHAWIDEHQQFSALELATRGYVHGTDQQRVSKALLLWRRLVSAKQKKRLAVRTLRGICGRTWLLAWRTETVKSANERTLEGEVVRLCWGNMARTALRKMKMWTKARHTRRRAAEGFCKQVAVGRERRGLVGLRRYAVAKKRDRERFQRISAGKCDRTIRRYFAL